MDTQDSASPGAPDLGHPFFAHGGFAGQRGIRSSRASRRRRLHRSLVTVLSCAAFVVGSQSAVSPASQTWRPLAPGVQYAAFDVPQTDVRVSDTKLHVVRINPARAKLAGLTVADAGGKPKTAAQWAKDNELVVVTNLGMYQQDHRTHVGYARIGARVNSGRWVSSYLSVLTFGGWRCRSKPQSAVGIVDLKQGGRLAYEHCHAAVVQNLRLIAASNDGRKGRSVWSPKRSRRWSEAALAQDRQGRLLMLFCRTPLSMAQFNRLVLRLPLGIVRAMHLEGGPEASLSIHGGGVHLDLAGSFETGFWPRDDNHVQWPLPNVLGVRVPRNH
jgi:hypothetical protein